MRQIKGFSMVAAFAATGLVFLLFAFSARPGAHSVQVYVDDNLVVERYIDTRLEAPKVALDAAHNQQLIVRYNECGRTVTGRKLTIRNSKGAMLKEWSFGGESTGFNNAMSCSVKELSALKSKDASPLRLYYTSKDFAEGQQIASLVFTSGSQSASK